LDIQAFWSRKGPLNYLLLPLSLLFGMAAALRRWAYRYKLLRSGHPGVPVIVAGNLTVGGSGKTPFVIWLVQWLKSRGHRPGVVSRGYGRSDKAIRCVKADSTAQEVGDEPLLIHVKTGAPVAVGADRLAAARMLRAQFPDVDVIVSDDGLQHYRLQRDLELVLADARSLFGNGWLLPAGPLREPVARLNEADALILSQRDEVSANIRSALPVFSVKHEPAGFRNLADGSLTASLPGSGGRQVQVVTGIARPENFFALLKRMGIICQPKVFPDHHPFSASEIDPQATVVMTEKDAVKCKSFAGPDWWALELKAIPSHGLEDWLAAELARY
jgi:tetraacyldisaccharide 4'-kinase